MTRGDASPMRGPTPWPLVGREHQLRLVDDALAVPGNSIVLTGASGVGKSRLAQEAIERARAREWFVRQAVATRAAAAIPFGALATILPDDLGGVDRLALLRTAGAALQAGAADRRFLFLVDDAHLLDDASAALVYQLGTDTTTSVLATVRSGEPAPDPLTALWKDGYAERIELPVLMSQDVATLLGEVLRGEVESSTVRKLETVSEGNPLFLRELVTGGLDSGSLTCDDRVWRWRGPLLSGTRLLDLVGDRLAGLNDDQVAVLEILALGEPLAASVLEALSSTAALIAVERGGWLATSEDLKRVNVRLAHPLYTEVLRARIPPLRARAIRRDLADAQAAAGEPSTDDLLRIVTWRLDSEHPQPARELTRAARAALGVFDFALAERLARAAADAEGSTSARMALSRALIGQAKVEEAEVVLSSIDVSSDPRQLTRVASARAANLWFGLGRVADAEALLQRCEALAADGDSRDVLTNLHALFALTAGRALDAESIADSVLARPSPAPAAVATALVAIANANLFLGHVQRVRAAAKRGLGISADAGVQAGALSLQLSETPARANWIDGRLTELETDASHHYGRAIEEQSEPARAMWALHLGSVALQMGRVVTARRWLEEAVALTRDVEPIRLAAALRTLAEAHLFARDLDSARTLIVQVHAVRTSFMTVFALRTQLVEAWLAACEGDLSRAHDLAIGVADQAHPIGDHQLEVEALHAVARLGGAEVVADRIEALTADMDASLLRTWAKHVRALADRDGPALDVVSATLESMGARLTSAEASAAAVAIYRTAGLRTSASVSRGRAIRLLRECEGASTPTLTELDSNDFLTQREREVATLASKGLASRAIAERLGVSVRTVDNHLHKVYTELGVRGRDELAEVFGGPSAASTPAP